MSNLQDLIKKIKVEKTNNSSYVYYTRETGKIHKISSFNLPDENFEIIEVSRDSVTPILSGERRTDEFKVKFNLKTKKTELDEVSFSELYKLSDIVIYQLPKKTSHKNIDVFVRQNIDGKIWEILLGSSLKKYLRSTKYKFEDKLYFSVTSKNDPNIFYRSLEVSIGTLLSNDFTSIPFRYEAEHIKDNVSIYTVRHFESYLHEVINEKI